MQGSAASAPELIGRDRERAQLAALVSVAADGKGGIVLVSGEAGVGKTALVDVALSGAPLLQARAAASPVATPPLSPIAGLAHALRRDLPDEFAAATARFPALAQLLPELGDVSVVPDRAALFRATAGAFVAIARDRPLALVLDDLQWADHATLELLPELARDARHAPLLVVAIHRTDGIARGHPLRTLREALRRARILNEILVDPLDRQDALRMMEGLLGREVPADAGAAIVERSAGVPLFVEALAAALQSRSCFDAASMDAAALPLPETVRDAVLARVDALAPAGRGVAEAAAVAGSEFPLALLAALNGNDDGIQELLESGLVVERGSGAAFRTPLAREAVYAAIPWTRRRALHRRAAETLAASGGSIEQAAEHWEASGERERACTAWLEAASRSRRLYAHHDAMQQLRRALDLWPAEQRTSERLTALDQLGDSAQLAGRIAEALRAWREAADSASAALDYSAAGRALRKIANLHELSCDWARVLEARHAAVDAFVAGGERAESAFEGFAIATRLRVAGQYSAALEVLARAAGDAEAARRPDLGIRIAALTGNVQARSGRVAEGISAVRAALAAALDQNRPDLAGEVYQRLGEAMQRTGDYKATRDADLAAVQLCERHAQPALTLFCIACASLAQFRSGQWDEAAAASRRVLEVPGTDRGTRGLVGSVLGLVHAQRGELRKARPLLIEADSFARRNAAAGLELVSCWGLAVCDVAAKDDAAAAERYRGTLARWRRTEERFYAIPILRWASTCFARLGDRDGVRACADALNGILATFGLAETLSALAHALGELALLDGDAARAADQFTHAVSLLEDQALPLERVESQLRAAVACAACDRADEAVALLRDAARGAEHLGARPLADAVGKELRRLGQPLAGALGPRAGRRAEHAGLTPRQAQILAEISKGLTDKEVGRVLHLSPRTVEMHVAHALAALDCRSRAEAVRKATELGVLARAVQ